MKLGFQHTYADLSGSGADCAPRPVPQPGLLFWNAGLARELGLPLEGMAQDERAALFSGNALPEDARPFAQAYAGHQFGNFSPQLGDGRALLLGELLDPQGRRFDLALKGSGRTPFSRGGDGLAAVGPMLREVLISEALHALGIPTTRSLAVVATGDAVRRETLLPGAVLTRVASSHIRVGTFEFFAFRGDLERVRHLCDHAIDRHDPELSGKEGRHLAFFEAVVHRQASLVAQWMNVGFLHGVMNTDNMTVSGESIDFGPCAFLEGYDPAAVFSSIDRDGRYAFGNQPGIAQWNLARLAEALLPLFAPEPERGVELAMGVLEAWPQVHVEFLLGEWRRKLGLKALVGMEGGDARLAEDFLGLLHSGRVDFTQAWRSLGAVAEGDETALRRLFPDPTMPAAWLVRYRDRCRLEDGEEDAVEAGRRRAAAVRLTNPVTIPRNHRVEDALSAAGLGDLGLFGQLLRAIRAPYASLPGGEHFAEPAPAEVTAGYRTFCGT